MKTIYDAFIILHQGECKEIVLFIIKMISYGFKQK